jgi:hypothetical protein
LLDIFAAKFTPFMVGVFASAGNQYAAATGFNLVYAQAPC